MPGTARIDSPLAQLGLAVLALISFRIFLALQMTTAGIGALVSDLSHGGLAHQFAARLLTLDDISRMLVEGLRAYFG